MNAPVNTAGAIAAAQKTTPAAATEQNQRKALQNLVQRMAPQIGKALPSVITPERFSRIVLTAISANPNLAKCDQASFAGAMMGAAQLGLEPNTQLGQCYLIPYRNHGQLQCQLQLGYKGLLDLAYRSGEVTTVQAHDVCENDEFSYTFGLEPSLTHVPALKNRGPVIAYYAMWKAKNGGYGFEVMSKDEIIDHAKRFSQSYGNGPWQNNFDSMALKTVLKKALKYAPMHTDFIRAAAEDEAISTFNEETEELVTTPVDVVVDPATGEVLEGGEK